MRSIALIAALIGLTFGLFAGQPAAAQSGGQFCVRSFEDANANGLLDPESESLLTRGVSVELLDSSNLVVASAMLERSPNASSGIVCFQGLSDGEYSVLMSSADFTPTTDNLVSATISGDAMPTVIEFGAQRINQAPGAAAENPAAAPALTEEESLQAMVTRLAFSTVGAVVIMLLMLIVGFIVYWARLRPSAPQPVRYSQSAMVPPPEPDPFQPPPYNRTPTPQSTPAVPEPPLTLDDTNPTNPVVPEDENRQ